MERHDVTRIVGAPVAAVWGALVDPGALESWRAPEGMCCRVHELEPVVGGSIRVSLTYLDGRESGKSGGATDTYRGRFVAVEPLRRLVEELEFETQEPAMAGRFRVTTTLRAQDGSTAVTIGFSDLPQGISESDNEAGTAMALAQLARFVETGDRSGP